MEKTYNELHITPSSDYPLFLDFIMSLSDEAIEEIEGTLILRSEEELQLILFGVEAFAKELSLAKNRPITVKTKFRDFLNSLEFYVMTLRS